MNLNQGLINEIIEEVKKENTQVKEQNRILTRRVYELQSDLAQSKIIIHKLKACYNCGNHSKANCDECGETKKNWIYVGDVI